MSDFFVCETGSCIPMLTEAIPPGWGQWTVKMSSSQLLSVNCEGIGCEGH